MTRDKNCRERIPSAQRRSLPSANRTRERRRRQHLRHLRRRPIRRLCCSLPQWTSWPLSAAHAEPDNLRALTAVIDTSAQRAESAICVQRTAYDALRMFALRDSRRPGLVAASGQTGDTDPSA